MKLTLTRKELYEGLQTVGRAVSPQSTLPVLKNVLIEPGDNVVKLSATDLELAIEVLIPARVSEPGVLTVPARTFLDIVGALPEADVELVSDDRDNLVLRCRRSEYRIHGLAAEDFPTLPEVTGLAWFKAPQPLVKEVIRQTALAASTDDTRPILTGVCISLTGSQIRVVATDTHRLAVRNTEATEAGGEITVIVPVRAMNELGRALADEGEEQLEVRIDRNQILFHTPRVTLVSRLIDGQFPPYQRVIPSGRSRRLTIEREEFQSALRRTRIVARDGSARDRVILITEGENLVLTAEAAQDLGRAHEEIGVEREGDDIKIAFNVNFLVDGVGILATEKVHLDLNEPLTPAVLRPVDGDDYLMVVMPMQV